VVKTQLTVFIVVIRAHHPIRVQYPKPVSDAYLKEIQQSPEEEAQEPAEVTDIDPIESFGADPETLTPRTSKEDAYTSQADAPDTPTRFVEKARLHWNGKTCKWFRSIERPG